MNQTVSIEVLVDAEAAEILKDPASRERAGRLLSRIALLHKGTDKLAAALERTSNKAQEAGLTDDEIDAELAAYNAESRT